MTQTVNVPGIGQLNFPDGMSQPEMATAIQKNFPQIHTKNNDFDDSLLGQGAHKLSDLYDKYTQDGVHSTNGNMLSLGEAGANLATGLGSSLVGGFSGVGRTLYNLATGENSDTAIKKGLETYKDIQEGGTYQPRTTGGKLLSEVIPTAFGAAKDIGGYAGSGLGMAYDVARNGGVDGVDLKNGTGVNAGRALGEILPDAYAAIEGGRSLASALRKPEVVAPSASPFVKNGIDYDVPTYVRIARERALLDAQKVRAIDEPIQAPIELPESTNENLSALEKYANENHQSSPYGTLDPTVPELPPAESLPQSSLDKHAQEMQVKYMLGARGLADIYKNSNSELADLSPLDKFKAYENIQKLEKNDSPSFPELTPIQEDIPIQYADEAVKPSKNQLYDLEKQTENGGLSHSEQMERAKTLNRLGIESTRKSALEGDSMTGSVQSQMTKFNEPAGVAAKVLFDNERLSLEDHAKNIIDDTGGTFGNDQGTLNVRGQTVVSPFDGLREYFNNVISDLYKKADEASNGKPSTTLTELQDFLDTKHNFSGQSENSHLGNGIRDYLRHQEIMDRHGEMQEITPQQAEGIKKYINSQWSPKTSGLAEQIKSTIDKDVLSSAGEDIYKQARDMFKMKKETLDDPKGISKILDYDPKTPINRTTAFDKIPDALDKLSPDQFQHIVGTLEKILDPKYDTPIELKNKAIASINEIRAHIANGLLDAGSKFQSKWSAKDVTQYLKNHSATIPMVFDKTAIGKMRDLNNAGHILSVDKSYPGATAQASNAVKQGLMSHLISTATTIAGGGAGSLMGPLGAAGGAGLGKVIGGKIASNLGEAASLKKFNKGIVNINDLGDSLQPEAGIAQRVPTLAAKKNAALRAEMVRMINQKALRAQQESLIIDQHMRVIPRPMLLPPVVQDQNQKALHAEKTQNIIHSILSAQTVDEAIQRSKIVS